MASGLYIFFSKIFYPALFRHIILGDQLFQGRGIDRPFRTFRLFFSTVEYPYLPGVDALQRWGSVEMFCPE